jgi:hypothetical protein
MAVELAPRTGLIGKPTTNDLVLPPDLTLDEWAGAVEHADMIVESSPWWLVSLMAYGQRRFGEQHSQILPTREEDPQGIRQSRLKQAAWMASIYPTVNTRVPGLSYTHHRVVAELDPDDRSALLREAVAANLSTRDLVVRVKEKQEQARAIPAESAPVCAADEGTWRPTPDDLTDEAAARMRFERTMAGRGASFETGWVAALAWAEQLDCFRRE